MSAELLATSILIALNVIGVIVGAWFFRRFYVQERQKLMVEIDAIIQDKMQGAIDIIGEAFEGIISSPMVKGAMTTLGKKGGEARAENILVDTMAVDLLDSPQFAGYRMAAEALGLDIEGYIEKHGAVKTLKSIQSLASIAGIDIMKLDLGSLATPGGSGGSGNPYLGK